MRGATLGNPSTPGPQLHHAIGCAQQQRAPLGAGGVSTRERNVQRPERLGPLGGEFASGEGWGNPPHFRPNGHVRSCRARCGMDVPRRIQVKPAHCRAFGSSEAPGCDLSRHYVERLTGFWEQSQTVYYDRASGNGGGPEPIRASLYNIVVLGPILNIRNAASQCSCPS